MVYAYACCCQQWSTELLVCKSRAGLSNAIGVLNGHLLALNGHLQAYMLCCRSAVSRQLGLGDYCGSSDEQQRASKLSLRSWSVLFLATKSPGMLTREVPALLLLNTNHPLQCLHSQTNNFNDIAAIWHSANSNKSDAVLAKSGAPRI
jgi:hypothetical protein